MTTQPTTSIAEQEADKLAASFHYHYERLAESFGYVTRKDSAVAWEQVPENNKRLMRAVASEILKEFGAENEKLRGERDELRGKFALLELHLQDTFAGLHGLSSRCRVCMAEAVIPNPVQHMRDCAYVALRAALEGKESE